MKYILKDGIANAEGVIALLWGNFLTNIIDFIIVAFVMFLIVKAVNKTKKKEEPTPPSDLLKKSY